MSKRRPIPVALTVAGSDSGGGAGIQADLKTFAALGVHGTSAITCITAQNPEGVRGIQACSVGMVRRQLEAVCDELPPAAVKTGMLYSAPIIHAVAAFFRRRQGVPLVVDPVMVSTSGAKLLKPEAVRALRTELVPLATLVTPNLDEAEILIGVKLTSVTDLRAAARTLYQHFGCAALVKGGHLKNMPEAADILFDGRTEWLLRAPFIKGVRTHGTGCTYSAAIAGYLARGFALPQAVKRAKEFVTQAIAGSYRVRKHFALNPRSH